MCPSNDDILAFSPVLREPAASGASVDEQVAELARRYSERAEAYDRLWSPVLQSVARRLLEHLALARAADVLDVGTGAGALLPLIRQAAPRARVLGIDNAEGMLRLARGRHPGPLAQMNVERIGLPSGRFDIAVIAFVLFHLACPDRCLTEVCRVLRPGGMAGTATWGAERWPAADDIWDRELTRAGAATYTLPAVQNRSCCDSEPKVRKLLHAAGFKSVRTWQERLVYRWPAPSHFEYQMLVTSRARLESLGTPARAECLRRIRRRLADAAEDDYVYTGEVICAVASKPGPPGRT